MALPGHRPPRAVFLDAGNTILRMNYGAIAAQLGRHGVAVEVEAVQRAEWRARVRLDADLARGGASTESGGTAGAYVRWRQAFNPPFGLWTLAEPTAAPALAVARAAGLRAGVISNSNGSVCAILQGLGLADTLDFVLDSSEVGVEKPDPRIFRLALERAGVSAGEAVYVGDLYSIDVLGARAVGLGAVLLDPGGCWGPRDCPVAPDVLAAVRLIVDGWPAPPGSGPRRA
jgi:FMN phosphatase YigB (HAD superfamily)